MSGSVGRTGILVAIAVALASSLRAQEQQRYVRPSQKGSVTQRVNTTDITIEYSRPIARGRTLFGPDGLEKWGKTWTPGANEATTVEFSKDVKIQGRELEAGRYSVWTVLGPEEWSVIFNSETDLWHLPYRAQDSEVMEVSARTQEGSHMEALTWYFPDVGPDDATLVMHWGTTVLPLHIEVERELPVHPSRAGN